MAATKKTETTEHTEAEVRELLRDGKQLPTGWGFNAAANPPVFKLGSKQDPREGQQPAVTEE
jgi:hypothetical protein